MEQPKKKIPYQNRFDLCKKATSAANWLLLVAGVLSLYFIWDPFATILPWLSRMMMVVNILLIILQFALQALAEIYLYPEAEHDRLKGFFDNSSKLRFLDEDVQGYYDNDGIKPGLYKLAVNSFQNCFYTCNIAKRMTPKLALRNIAFFLLFIIVAALHWNGAFVLSVTQLFVSSLFLWTLFQHFYFVHCVKRTLAGFQETFSVLQKDAQQAIALFHVVCYEKALASYGNLLDSSIYNKLNSALDMQWEQMKLRYNIKDMKQAE
jgi:hypothetical protein